MAIELDKRASNEPDVYNASITITNDGHQLIEGTCANNGQYNSDMLILCYLVHALFSAQYIPQSSKWTFSITLGQQ